MPSLDSHRAPESSPQTNASTRSRVAISLLSFWAYALAAILCLLMTGGSALASCACSGPSEPDPVTEVGAKVLVAGGVIAFVGYRYYKQRTPRG